MNTSTLNIVLSTDNNYVMPTGILMCSVCVNTPCKIAFFVLTGKGFSEKSKSLMQQSVKGYDASVVFLPVPENLESLLPMGKPGQPQYITVATYYRLFLQDILPESIDKVLYLDGDIVCRSSLLPLWNTDIEGKPVAAVYEIENNDHRYERLCYDEKDGYFNAGVLLINMKYWREHDVQKTFIEFLNNHSDRIVYHDQDVLNSVFHDNKVVLDVKFNVLNSYFVRDDIRYLYSKEEIEAVRKEPVLVHFSSHLKPWFKGCSHPFTNEFLYYKGLSPWKRIKLHVFPSPTLRGKISNIFVWLGLTRYNGNYIS